MTLPAANSFVNPCRCFAMDAFKRWVAKRTPTLMEMLGACTTPQSKHASTVAAHWAMLQTKDSGKGENKCPKMAPGTSGEHGGEQGLKWLRWHPEQVVNMEKNRG
jgi:hypothetical protein